MRGNRPQLDHYVGRQLVGIVEPTEADWNWGIRLDGDVIIRNKDHRRTNLDILREAVGLHFMCVTLGELDTTLQFGTERSGVIREVSLTPTKYSIAAPGVDEHEPQRADVEEEITLPPDPSPERVADGPEQTDENN